MSHTTLPSSILDKIEAVLSPEEMQLITTQLLEEKPNPLHAAKIGTMDAFERYYVHPNSISRWISKGWVRRLKEAEVRVFKR